MPNTYFDTENLSILGDAIKKLGQGFTDGQEGEFSDETGIRDVVLSLAEKMQDNYPYHHPLYAGQMLKPPHPVARIAYALAQLVNPNNHALDGGRASSALEKQVVAALAVMFGYDRHLGHLTGGGTMANLEALWVAGKTHPGKVILASSQAHYTHSRISEVLALSFESVPVDNAARMDMQALEARLKQGNVGTIVATLGTTGVGSVDPLPEILALARQYDCRVHVDSAYGGYYVLADNLDGAARAAYDAIGQADSIVVDPHKHGLQPYGCGCILFRDPAVGRFYNHDSPYTYFSSDELHLGEISLECSRAGASAAALWATMELLPVTKGGDFAVGLENCHRAALHFYGRVCADDRWMPVMKPDLDIVIWAAKGDTASAISAQSEKIFDAAAEEGLHLAVMSLPRTMLQDIWPTVTFDQDQVRVLRTCLMKSNHADWMDEIWQRLQQAYSRL